MVAATLGGIQSNEWQVGANNKRRFVYIFFFTKNRTLYQLKKIFVGHSIIIKIDILFNSIIAYDGFPKHKTLIVPTREKHSRQSPLDTCFTPHGHVELNIPQFLNF